MSENDKYTGRVDKFMRELEDTVTLPKGAFVERISIDYSTLRDPDLPYKAEVKIQRLPNADGPRFVFDWDKTPEKALEKVQMRLSKEWPKKYPSVEDTIKKVHKVKTRSGFWIKIPSVTIVSKNFSARPLENRRFLCTFEILGANSVSGSGDTVEEAVWGAWYALERQYDIRPPYVPRVMVLYGSTKRPKGWLYRNADGMFKWGYTKNGAYEFPEEEYLYWADDPEALFNLLPITEFSRRQIGTVEWVEKPLD